MATPYCVPLANRPTLKRSFAVGTTNPEPPSPKTTAAQSVFQVPAHPSRVHGDRQVSFLQKRRLASNHLLANMPVAAGPQAYQSQFPSFMSVFGMDSSTRETREVDGVSNTKLAPLLEDECLPQRDVENASPQGQLQYKHRDSTSTQASESTNPSPTTTISTADSSSLTDPSPGSPPESPITIVPLSSFSGTSFGPHILDELTMSEKPRDGLAPLNFERPMTSPTPRKPRNAKGLALNLPSSSNPVQSSAPTSPSFLRPPPPKPRRKPSLLSLQTSATPGPLTRLTIEPPTPGIRPPMLRHASSTPLFSPNIMPSGGMRLPPFDRSNSGLSSAFRRPPTLKESGEMSTGLTIDEEESPIRTQLATRTSNDILGDPFDVPASQEDTKSPGYPHGPIQIYEPNVYLYLEPTADEAAQFDVIINVASEVKNPFKTAVQAKESKESMASHSSFDLMETDRDNMPIPDTAASNATFKTAFEYLPESQQTPTESSPTTPKPAFKEPEYIHVPWEHNTDITKDLMWLCETIEKRTREGKSVLVHCQQGASRSASLIIAYGIYSNPSLSVNDAYHEAQAKSKWISPNMKLMYALQDFQKEVEKKKLSPGPFKRTTGRSPTKHRLTLSADAADISPKEPQTAPLPCGRDSPVGTPSSRVRGNSSPNFGDVSPGPSSAPSSFAWTPQAEKEPTKLWTLTSTSQEPSGELEQSSGINEASMQFREGSFGAFPHAIPAFENDGPLQGPVLSTEKDFYPPPVISSLGNGVSDTSSSLPKNNFGLFPFGRFGRFGDSDSAHNPSPLLTIGFGFTGSANLSEKDISAPDTSDSSTRNELPHGDPLLSGGIFSSAKNIYSSQEDEFRGRTLSPPLRQTVSGLSERSSSVKNASFPFSRIGPGQRRSKTPTPGMLPSLKTQLAITPEIRHDTLSPRASEMTANPLRRQISFQGFSAYDFVPPAPGFELMSPRDVEFTNNPFRPAPTTNFSRPLSRSVQVPPTFSTASVPIRIDPRSPAMKGEAPIIRSIDELL